MLQKVKMVTEIKKDKKKPTKKEQLAFIFALGGGIFTAWLFYKMYGFAMSSLNMSYGFIGVIFTILAFLVGMGMANTINNAINKINS